MDYQTLSSLISSLGFPIVICGVMAYFIKYITDQHRDELTRINERHEKEQHELTEALNNNTVAIQKLTDYIMFGDSKDD